MEVACPHGTVATLTRQTSQKAVIIVAEAVVTCIATGGDC